MPKLDACPFSAVNESSGQKHMPFFMFSTCWSRYESEMNTTRSAHIPNSRSPFSRRHAQQPASDVALLYWDQRRRCRPAVCKGDAEPNTRTTNHAPGANATTDKPPYTAVSRQILVNSTTSLHYSCRPALCVQFLSSRDGLQAVRETSAWRWKICALRSTGPRALPTYG